MGEPFAPQPLLLLAGALCLLVGVLLGAKAANAWRAFRERARGHAQRAQGERGERDAERLLRAHGYAIRARDASHGYDIAVDGAIERVGVALDFIVEKGGEVLVAEVKTGRDGARVQKAETRRQLLEYQLATGARCVLLVDPDAGRITEVAFPIGAAQPMQAPAPSLLRVSALAVALVTLVVWWVNR